MEHRQCCKCIWGERYPGSNWGWYCNRKKTIVRPTDYCGYYSPMYKY